MLKVALGQKPHVEIYGTDYETPDGTCIRDYIHILDLSARAHPGARAEESAFYNLGTGGGTSVREVIDICREVTGKEIPVVEKPRRPGRSAAVDCRFGKNQTRAWLETAVPRICALSSRAHGAGTRNFRTATEINEI